MKFQEFSEFISGYLILKSGSKSSMLRKKNHMYVCHADRHDTVQNQYINNEVPPSLSCKQAARAGDWFSS